MSQLIRCKVCGYVMEAGKLKDVCPACGVKKELFEEYTDTISHKRRMILELDIHPILVHFSVASAGLLFLLIASSYILRGGLLDDVYSAAKILAVVLPLFILVTSIGGLFDGIVRFKKILRSPILKTKIGLSIGFFIVSLTQAFCIYKLGLMHASAITINLGLSMFSFIFMGPTAWLGTRILNSAFKGE